MKLFCSDDGLGGSEQIGGSESSSRPARRPSGSVRDLFRRSRKGSREGRNADESEAREDDRQDETSSTSRTGSSSYGGGSSAESLTGRLLRRLERSESRIPRFLIPSDVRRVVEQEITAENFPDLSREQLLMTKYTWAAKLSHFQKYGAFSRGNHIDILETGDVGFPRMLDAIKTAKKRVWLESYIVDDSAIAERFVDALCHAKTVNGVPEVVMVLDGIGGREMSRSQITRLQEAGVKVVVFNAPGVRSVLLGAGTAAEDTDVASSVQPTASTSAGAVGSASASENTGKSAAVVEESTSFFSAVLQPWPLRDHRKILICDDIGFCGSLNVMREDCGPELGGIGGFYDVHCQIQGPAVKDLGDVFLDSLIEAGEEEFADSLQPTQLQPYLSRGTKTKDALSVNQKQDEDEKGGSYVQVVRSNMRLRGRNRSLQKVLTKAMYGAQHSLHITTPYFFPPLFLRRSLWRQLRKPESRVRMSFLLSGVSDVSPIPYDTLGQKHVIRKLLVEERKRKQRAAAARAAEMASMLLDDQEGQEDAHAQEQDAASAAGSAQSKNEPDREVGEEDEDHVAIYLSEGEHMHAKIVVVDSLFATIGSFNFDWFSGRRNLEVGLCIFDHRLAKKLEQLHKGKIVFQQQRENSASSTPDRSQHLQHVRTNSSGSENHPNKSTSKNPLLHTWFGVPLVGADGRGMNTVRRQHLDQWEYANIFPRAVSFWAYNSVWFASCNLWDGLDHVSSLKRRMKQAKDDLIARKTYRTSRDHESYNYKFLPHLTFPSSSSSSFPFYERSLRDDLGFLRQEADRRVRADERMAFSQMAAQVLY
ncbi:unnamed protein product [Amoebophrya sp. A25]|nr:unnamed protein product [Amoebophrya sp. A25]|eukprot:GSA25T00013666001.1